MASHTFLEKIEILPGRLYFCTVPHKSPAVSENGQPSYAIQNPSPQYIYYCTDASLTYTAFFADFGPLNIGLTYNFCRQLETYLTQSKMDQRPVIYYCSQHPHYRANSAILICAYLIFVMGMTVEQAYAPFIGISPRLISSRDAAFCINSYPIFPLDCAKAFYRASQLNHFNYDTFDVQKHDQLARLEHGDVSWIVPGKFIAFSGPVAQRREVGPGLYALAPEAYVPLFHSLGVTCVVRFNKKCYDRTIFTRGGIRHVDLFYEDGGNPSDEILMSFLKTCENETGAIAVHCKAGLGRTGTNIAAYMMKHYGYTAREASAWCRVCRPGSVVGPQQQYLETKQNQMWAEGRRYRQEGRGGGSARLSAGRPRSASAAPTSSRLKKISQKTFTTIEQSVTARLLHRIQQEAEGRGNDRATTTVAAVSASASSSPSSNKDNGRTSSLTASWEQEKRRESSSRGKERQSNPSSSSSSSQGGVANNKLERVLTPTHTHRPNTTESSGYGNQLKSAERSGFKNQFEGGASGQDKRTSAARKETHGSDSYAGRSGSSGGSRRSNGTSSSNSSVSSGVMSSRRAVTSEQRPNTSAGVTTRRTLLSQTHKPGGGSSGNLRSGGGLNSMNGQSTSRGSGTGRVGVAGVASRSRVSSSQGTRVGSRRGH